MKRRIFRNTITITVYTPDRSLDAARISDFEAVRHVIAEMEDGEFIGEAVVGPAVEVTSRRRLRQELIEIGNDGTFFDAFCD